MSGGEVVARRRGTKFIPSVGRRPPEEQIGIPLDGENSPVNAPNAKFCLRQGLPRTEPPIRGQAAPAALVLQDI